MVQYLLNRRRILKTKKGINKYFRHMPTIYGTIQIFYKLNILCLKNEVPFFWYLVSKTK